MEYRSGALRRIRGRWMYRLIRTSSKPSGAIAGKSAKEKAWLARLLTLPEPLATASCAVLFDAGILSIRCGLNGEACAYFERLRELAIELNDEHFLSDLFHFENVPAQTSACALWGDGRPTVPPTMESSRAFHQPDLKMGRRQALAKRTRGACGRTAISSHIGLVLDVGNC